MPSVTWDDSAKFKLLLLVIDKCEAKLGTKNWDEVAKAFGHGVTGSAVRFAPTLHSRTRRSLT